MIHEIFPHRFDNSYIADRKAQDNDLIFNYADNSILFKVKGDDFTLPQKKDLPRITDSIETIFLFTLDSDSCFLVPGNLNCGRPDLVYKEVTIFRTLIQQEIAWAAIAGYHLANWYLQNRFCGKCGTATLHKADERALRICYEIK